MANSIIYLNSIIYWFFRFIYWFFFSLNTRHWKLIAHNKRTRKAKFLGPNLKKTPCNSLYVRNVAIFRGFPHENVKEPIAIRLNLFMKTRKSGRVGLRSVRICIMCILVVGFRRWLTVCYDQNSHLLSLYRLINS